MLQHAPFETSVVTPEDVSKKMADQMEERMKRLETQISALRCVVAIMLPFVIVFCCIVVLK